jgi:CDP-6-deoxy-D-xylo-4-hexulose-3-dehydrase
MLRCGTLFRHDEAGSGYGVVLGPADVSGRYPALLLEKADADTPPELRIRAGEDAPGAVFTADLRIDPYNCRRMPAGALPQGAASGLALATAAMDRIFRAMGKAAARGQYGAVHTPAAFTPGVSPVPVSGKCWGPEEMESLTDASLDFWLTAGRFAEAFEKKFAQTVGRRHALAVNSGSSANLVALSALCSPKLGDRRLKPGDEVITVAAGFPTTVAPIVQNGLVPVFVDAAPPTYNALPGMVEEAVGPRTRAIFMAHTLGNPFDLNRILKTVRKHNLWLVEDSCDALGARFTLQGETQSRMCGTFGHLATYSFYPAHHITMGEGGAVICDDPELYRIALSLRDWGRDCWCAPGRDDTCKKRYQWRFPRLPEGYDHKYVYSHLGYNLKVTDMQAAVGLRQLERLDGFVEARRRNFAQLREALAPLDGEMLTLPQATPGSRPSWFGFLITLKPQVDRTALLRHLNAKKIGTRLLFAGNILRQPCFEGMRCRQAGELHGTDEILNRTFWVGCFPGLAQAHMEYMAQTILDYFRK